MSQRVFNKSVYERFVTDRLEKNRATMAPQALHNVQEDERVAAASAAEDLPLPEVPKS